MAQAGGGTQHLDLAPAYGSSIRCPGGERRLLRLAGVVGDDHDLRRVGGVDPHASEQPRNPFGGLRREDDHRPGRVGRLVQAGRHRDCRPVANLAVQLDGGWRGRAHGGPTAVVSDLPAGGLDLDLQGVGGRPVAAGAGLGPLAHQMGYLGRRAGWFDGVAHPRRIAAGASRSPARPESPRLRPVRLRFRRSRQRASSCWEPPG